MRTRFEIGESVRLTQSAATELSDACCWTPRGMLLTNDVSSFTAKVVEVLGAVILVRDPSGTVWNFQELDLIREADYSPDFTESGNF